MNKKEENTSDEECEDYIINSNTKKGQKKLFNSEAFVNSIKKHLFQMGNLFQTGQTRLKNK